MPAHVSNISFDCDDALTVAQFWSEVLGRPVDAGASSGFASIGGDDEERSEPAWYFEKVVEPKSAKNRMHVDLVDADPSVIERMIALGASVIARHEIGGGQHSWTVMRDPEGNEFCVADKAFTG